MGNLIQHYYTKISKLTHMLLNLNKSSHVKARNVVILPVQLPRSILVGTRTLGNIALPARV